MLKILWHSNAPWTPSGYGVQTRLCCARMRDAGHEVAVSAFYGLEGSAIHWDGIPIFPRAAHAYGQDILPAHARHWNADIVFSLIDAWVYDPRQWGQMRWAPWFPVDSEPIPPAVLQRVRLAYQPLVYSKFAEEQMRLAGVDCRYVPHCVDTQSLTPHDRRAARQALGLPQDVFLFGMVAANKDFPARKAFQQHLDAFKLMHQQHPDTHLLIHTFSGPEQGGMNLPEYLHYLGLERAVTFNDQYRTLLGLGDDYMRLCYSAMDCLLSVSMGEGFGVPILEAQACGTPVIVGDWTSMGELCFCEPSIKIPREQSMPFVTKLAAYQFIPFPQAIWEAMGTLYARGGATEEERKQIAAHARDYDADAVYGRYWAPLLQDLESRIREGAGELKLVTFG